jgi:hypothetical protein
LAFEAIQKKAEQYEYRRNDSEHEYGNRRTIAERSKQQALLTPFDGALELVGEAVLLMSHLRGGM